MSDTPTNQEAPKFAGFEYANPELGFTQVGNANFAILAQIDNLSELKVVLYLMRNTWGYQEYETEKYITTDEFVNGRKRRDGTRIDEGCGLKTTAVKEGLTKAIKHGYVACTIDNSDRGRIKKYYVLKMNEKTKPKKNDSDGRNATMPSHETTMPSRKATIKGTRYDHRTEKETIETNLRNKPKEREKGASLVENNKDRLRSLSSKQSFSSSQEDLSPEAISVLIHWDEIIGMEAPRTEKHVRAAKALAKQKPTKEDLLAEKEFLLKNNPDWYKKLGLDLHDLANNWGKWKSTKDMPADSTSPGQGQNQTTPVPTNDLRALAERQRQARKQA